MLSSNIHERSQELAGIKQYLLIPDVVQYCMDRIVFHISGLIGSKHFVRLIRLMLFLPGILNFLSLHGQAQYDPITLKNPSFEGTPGGSVLPPHWYDCGFPRETPPDTHPGKPDSLIFDVSNQPQHGKTFIGLVTRSNETYESTSTPLSSPMLPGICYSFNIYLSKSNDYVSGNIPHTTPCILRIWGGQDMCDKRELLGSTSIITHPRWVRYQFTFEPKQELNWFILEAYYLTPRLGPPTTGNILLDNASVIRPVPCVAVEKEEPVAKNEPVTKPTPTPKPAPTPPKEELTLGGMKRAQLKPGAVLSVDKIFFQADTSAISSSSYPALEAIYNFLSVHSDVHLEVGGHTNGNCDHPYCDKLSEARAKVVSDYLIGKGIASERVRFKGYGKRKPIASNATPEGRRRNQRVELTILSMNTQ